MLLKEKELLRKTQEALGAMGAYSSLGKFTKAGGTFSVFALPNK